MLHKPTFQNKLKYVLERSKHIVSFFDLMLNLDLSETRIFEMHNIKP